MSTRCAVWKSTRRLLAGWFAGGGASGVVDAPGPIAATAPKPSIAFRPRAFSSRLWVALKPMGPFEPM